MTGRLISTLTGAMTAVAVITGAGAGVEARANVAGVLDHAPAGAEVVVIVPDVGETNRRIAELAERGNVPVEAMQDVMGTLKQQAGIEEGFDDAGSLVFALTGVGEAVAGGDDPSMLTLVPVTDYAAFVEGFAGDAGADVTSLVMPTDDAVYARQSGGFAVLGESEVAVAAYEPGGSGEALLGKAGELGGQYLTDASAAIYVDFERLGPALAAGMDELAEFQMEMDGEMAELDGMEMDAMNEMFEAMQVFSEGLGRVLSEDALAGVMALGLDERGAAVTSTIEFRDGAEALEMFPGGEAGRSADLLARIPEAPYLFSYAMDTEAVRWGELLAPFIDMIPDDEAFTAVYRDAFDLLDLANGYAGAMYVPDQMAMMGGGFLNAVSVVSSDDPQAYRTAMKEYIEAMHGLEMDMGMGMDPMGGMEEMEGMEGMDFDMPDQEPMRFTASYSEGAIEVDGVSVDQYEIGFDMPQGGAGEMEMMMMGGMGYGGYVAVKDGYVISTTTTDPEQLRGALAALDAPQGIGSAGAVADVRERALAPNAVAESYVSVGGLAEMVNMFTMMMGMPPIEPEPDLPPVVSSLGLQGNGVALRAYVPVETVRFISDAVEQFGPMMGPGGPGMQPGQPQGPAPAPF